ncbi:radical SAM protein [Nitrospira sp. CMX1]
MKAWEVHLDGGTEASIESKLPDRVQASPLHYEYRSRERDMSLQLIKAIYRKVQAVTRLTEKQMLTPYYWIPYHLYGNGKAWRPLFVSLEVTYICNLKCQMCSLVSGEMVTKAGQRKNPELIEPDGSLRQEISTDEYLKLIQQMSKAGVKAVKLTGREPALRKDILTLANAVKRGGMHLSMISNGSAKPDIYTELVRIGLDSITISVDGTEHVHDQIRGMIGSFAKTQAAIDALIKEKKITGRPKPRIGVTCAVSALNQRDLGNLAELFKDSEIDDLNFGYLHFSTEHRDLLTAETIQQGPSSALHLKKAVLPDSVLQVNTANLVTQVTEIKAQKDRYKPRIQFSPDLSAEEIALQYTNESFTLANKCFYAWYSTRIDPWGQMYPCWIDVRLGDIRKTAFEDLWNGDAYRSFRRMIRNKKLVPKCSTCCVLNDKYWSKLPTFRN